MISGIKIQSPQGLYPIDQANKIATQMTSNEHLDGGDWKYVSIDLKNGMGRIDLYDGEGFLIQSGVVF
jgi:hypothetical protein